MAADLESMSGIVRSTDHYDSWLPALEPAFAHDLKQKLKVMAVQPGWLTRAAVAMKEDTETDPEGWVTYREPEDKTPAGGHRQRPPSQAAGHSHQLPRGRTRK